ncbi:hypothetical protein ESCOCP327B2_22745 [Escherichia coli]
MVCVVGRMRDLILQLSKSSIYSTKPYGGCLAFTSQANPAAPFEPEVKHQAVMELCTRQVSASEIARRIGVRRTIVYKLKGEIIGNSAYQTIHKHNEPSLLWRQNTVRCRRKCRSTESGNTPPQMKLDILKRAPNNLIARDFKVEQPNQKWLTDITEFQLPAGKVWLTPCGIALSKR